MEQKLISNTRKKTNPRGIEASCIVIGMKLNKFRQLNALL